MCSRTGTRGRWGEVHYRRLVIENGDVTFSLNFHPRLTVVSGVDAGARKGLVSELVGGLSSARGGVNLELADDHGRRLAILRPAKGGHRVIDLAGGSDISDEFRTADGRLDVGGRFGVDPARAAHELHLDRARLDQATRQEDAVGRLAELDQTELWSAAARVRITEDELGSSGGPADAEATDAELVARIERHHQMLESAIEEHRKLRRDASLVCAASLLAAVPVALIEPLMAIPILAVGLVTVLLAFIFRAKVEAAQRLERNALADAGVDSYLGYMVGRVNHMMDDTHARRRRTALADEHRQAAVRWTQIAGDVSVDWALAHHEQIETAAQLRRELQTLSQISTTAPELDDEATALAQALVTHLGQLRSMGVGGESMPLILDDPFTDMEPATKLTMMELLGRVSGSPQVIFLTDQDEVATWARLEALTGDVALVEPALSAAAPPASDAGGDSTDLAV